MTRVRKLIAIAVTAVLSASVANAQVPDALLSAVQEAVNANPDVQARWHAFRSAQEDQENARAGFRPSLDLEGSVGRQREDPPNGPSETFNVRSAQVTLNQIVYDGFFTRSEVSRFGHARMTRYFELLNEVEAVALEATRAYADVLKFREMVDFAKENYVEHRLVYDQIVERTQSGVGRGVDLELATGRLALAESNLLTELTNLHDVSARYLRIVGVEPAEDMGELYRSIMDERIPETLVDTIETAYAGNPVLKAAVADIRAGQALIDTRRSAFRPRVDLRARQNVIHSSGGQDDGTSRTGAVEVLFKYNLYRGGGDQALLRQAAEELNGARDTREKVCRDLRQTVSIAFNEINTLEEQLVYLDQHQLSMSKAREAYRQQFDIGERTLLDLLDGENEFFDARRAYTNAEYAQIVAVARTLAGMGQLLPVIGAVREELPTVSELSQDEDYLDAASVCPPLAPDMLQVDKDALLQEALQSMGMTR